MQIFTAPGGIATPFTFNMNYLPEVIVVNDGGNPLTSLRVDTQEDGVLHDWTAAAIAAMSGFMHVGALAANTIKMQVSSGKLEGKQVTISGVTSAAGAVPIFVSSDNEGIAAFTTSLSNIIAGNDTTFEKFTAVFLPNLVTANDRVQVFYKDGLTEVLDLQEIVAMSTMFQAVGQPIINNLAGNIKKIIVSCAAGGAAYVLRVKV